MTYMYLIDNINICQRVIHKILTHTKDTIAFAFQLAYDASQGMKISFITVSFNRNIKILRDCSEFLVGGRVGLFREKCP